jgi:hypothetical protein
MRGSPKNVKVIKNFGKMFHKMRGSLNGLQSQAVKNIENVLLNGSEWLVRSIYPELEKCHDGRYVGFNISPLTFKSGHIYFDRQFYKFETSDGVSGYVHCDFLTYINHGEKLTDQCLVLFFANAMAQMLICNNTTYFKQIERAAALKHKEAHT